MFYLWGQTEEMEGMSWSILKEGSIPIFPCATSALFFHTSFPLFSLSLFPQLLSFSLLLRVLRAILYFVHPLFPSSISSHSWVFQCQALFLASPARESLVTGGGLQDAGEGCQAREDRRRKKGGSTVSAELPLRPLQGGPGRFEQGAIPGRDRLRSD